MEQKWEPAGQAKTFYHARTLVVGFGDLGYEYAMRAKALGSYVVGIKRTLSNKPDCVDELYTMDSLEEELSKADVVALFLPQTEETYHLMNEKRLALMKESAILVHGGRGTAIDADALTDALNQGRLFGAATDVTEPEPLPSEHPLWKARNMLITPHISGKYFLQETLERVIQIAGKNLEAYSNGQPIENEVDVKTGYRKSRSY